MIAYIKKLFTPDNFLVVLSAVLLILAFPRTEWWPLAWFGLVPLLFVLDGKSLKQSFWLAYLCGLVFFAGCAYWFVYVTTLGAVLLILYFAVYFGLFGVLHFLTRHLSSAAKMIVLPASWVVCEFLRSNLISGFGWMSLGLSQYKILPLIQVADMAGVYGVTFWVVLINIFMKEIVSSIVKLRRLDGKLVVIPILTMLFVVTYGVVRQAQPHHTAKATIAVVQGNIDLPTHWDESSWLKIIHKHLAMSEHAATFNPDLIVWPETAFPGMLWDDALFLAELKNFIQEKKISVLFGSVVQDKKDYYNSAVLLRGDLQSGQVYNKIHLVPYGEYIPFRKYLPFLAKIIPIDDFSAGKDYTLFSLNDQPFSTLICFEDSVAGLTRDFVKKGSRLLISISNDAWFGNSKEPWLHLQSAVFRSVENRRSLVRASNVGVSAFIDQMGRITDMAEGDYGRKTYVDAVAANEVVFNDQLSFYTRFGDVFAWACMLLVGFVIGRNRLVRKP